MAESRSYSWGDIGADEVFDGVTRQRVRGETFSLVRYTYAPGSVFPVHSHPEEQLTIIHSGEIEFTVGDQLIVLSGGMLAIIPGDVPHGARVLGDEPVVSDNYIAAAERTELDFSSDASAGAGSG